jgi:hypothetical protein
MTAYHGGNYRRSTKQCLFIFSLTLVSIKLLSEASLGIFDRQQSAPQYVARGNSIRSPPAQRRLELSRVSFQLQCALARGLLYRRVGGRASVCQPNQVSSAVREKSSCR